MDINRSKPAIVFLFMIAICSWFLPLSIHAASSGISDISELSHQSGKLGAYRALIIGISDYTDPKIPDLETPLNDARAMAELLRKRYGFQVELLLNRKATKEGIYQALRKLAISTKTDDSVLIYYAGHGDLDRTYDDGWWIPADAKGGNPVTYLDNIQVQKAMRSMKARHVLLISDSCYSGSLFGQGRFIPQVIDGKYYLNLYNEKSRWGMTSGNKTPVSDRGTGNHSVFAYQLLKELMKNDKPFISTLEIYTRIAPIVSNNSEQTPLCRPIRNAGDQGGEFVFVASSKAKIDNVSDTNKDDTALLAERKRLEQERRELERIKAEIKELKRLNAEKQVLEKKKALEEKIIQEKLQSKQLAYLPQVPAEMQSDSHLNLAIFPFYESHISDLVVKDWKEYTNFIINFSENIPNVILTHSFYPYNKLKKKYNVILINPLINQDIQKQMWYGNSKFPKKKPDFNVLKKLAKKISADLILTFRIVSNDNGPNIIETDYNGYLIDIDKNIFYERKIYLDEYAFPTVDLDIIKKITKDIFKLYLSSNPELKEK